MGSDPTLLSRVGLAPPLALSLAWASRTLFLLLSRGPCAPSLFLLRVQALRPLLTSALLPHSCFAQLVPYHFLLAALLLVTPPHAQKASCVCLTGVSLSMCVMGVNGHLRSFA